MTDKYIVRVANRFGIYVDSEFGTFAEALASYRANNADDLSVVAYVTRGPEFDALGRWQHGLTEEERGQLKVWRRDSLK